MSGSAGPSTPLDLGGGGQNTGFQAQLSQLLQQVTTIARVLQGQAGNNLANLFAPTAFTAAGALTITQQIGFFSIRKATPAATTVNLMQGGGPYLIADGAGNASSDHITIVPPAGYTILGTSSLVISTNWGAVGLVLDGSNYLAWSVYP